MQPVLMIGCGGSGSKAVRHVRHAVKRRLLEIDWEEGIPPCWRFLGIDTPTTQEAASEIPPLPSGDYLSIGSRHKSYPALFNALATQWQSSRNADVGLMSGWLPDPSKASFPLSKGAGQTRAIGRAAALDSFPRNVVEPLKAAFQDIRGSRPDLDKVTRAFGYEMSGDAAASNQDPLVVVCSSIGGGTGAGIALDVVDTLRAVDSSGAHPVLVLFANDIFDLDTKDALAANSLAFLCEMTAAYWSEDDQIASPMSVVKSSQNSGNGPHSVFLLAKEQHGGASFGSTAEIYLAAGEVLSTWVTSEIVQEQVINFLVANWQNNASLNYGGYPFGQNLQQSIMSSFGVGKVSVGRDRFARWAEHKLAKATMESLLQGHLRHRSHRDAHLTDEDWVAHLGQKYAHLVYTAQGVTDGADRAGLAAAEEFHAPQDAVSAQHAHARRELLNAIPSGASMAAGSLHDHLRNTASRVKTAMLAATDSDADRRWRNHVVSDTSRAVSEIAAITSLPVALAAVEVARRTHNRQNLADIGERSGQAATAYQRLVDAGLNTLKQASGQLNASSEEVKQAVDKVAGGLAAAWQETRMKAAADLMGHADGELFEELESCLTSLRNEVARCLEDDQVAEWPQADEPGVSTKYHPSAVEFPMEGHSGWPSQLQILCREAVDENIPYGDLPIDPIRYRMVAGHKDDISPVLHLREHGAWTPGMSAPIECRGTIDEWIDRFRCWSNKPGSTYRRYVAEGLGDYLSSNDKHTGKRRVDHLDRVARFRDCLLSAKGRSKPMMRLSAEVYHATHDHRPEERFFRQMFPFKDEDPAAAVVDEVLGKDGWRSSLLDMSSVMLTSYFEFPVHPIVVASLTEPIAAAVANHRNADKRAHSFWQWRRARRLDGFVPLPRVLLERMVRGFAIARLCGQITADIDTAVAIIHPDTADSHLFPWPPLTRPSTRSDILAVLLESLALCYGSVNTDGLDTFAAYQALHEIGHRNEMSSPSDILARVLAEGPDVLRRTVDTPHITAATRTERLAETEKYLTGQQARFQRCRIANTEELQLRDRTGYAQRGVPTGELAEVYLRVYADLEQTCKSPSRGDDEV